MFSPLKDRMFRRRLAAETKAGSPRPVNLTQAKNIIVLFPADDAADRKAVDRWRDNFRKTGTKIKFAGYFAQPVGATDFGFATITLKHLNWYGVPEGEPVDAYRALECDVLLRLGPADHKELNYLAATRPAALKVGPYQPDVVSPYQLQFDAAPASSLKEQLAFIEHIFSYTNVQ